MNKKDHGLTAIIPGSEGDLTATNIKWQVNKNVPEVPSPVFYEGRIYMVKNGGIATCVDAKTGEVFYRGRLGVVAPITLRPSLQKKVSI